MQISYNNWFLSLDLNGGRIQELTHKDIKVFGTYHRVDGKVGNTHICAPSFDKEGQEKYRLPFHGYARTLMWRVNQLTTHTIQIKAKTVATDTYPAALELSQEFQLDDYFTHRVSVRHMFGKEVPVNVAIHFYWDTPRGWEEIKIKNQNQKKHIEENGFIDLQEKNLIKFPHASYELRSNGFKSAALWTGFKTDDTGIKHYNRDFCCIEPVIGWPGYFGTKESILKMGETKNVEISLIPLRGS